MKAKLLTRSLRYRIFTCAFPLRGHEKISERLFLTRYYTALGKTVVPMKDAFNGKRLEARARAVNHGE